MSDSIRLGRIFGIPVGLHWGALVIAAVFALSLATSALVSFAPDTSLTIRLLVASGGVVVFFASILAHEVGHAVVALRHGIKVSSITLWVMGGMAKLEQQPQSARSEFQIAIAGPAVSLGLGLFFASLGVIAAGVGSSRLVVVVLAWLAAMNLLLGLFNMLPAAPLDGGRVLTAALWRSSGDADHARLVAGRCGLILSLGLVLIGAYLLMFSIPINGILNIAVGATVYFAAAAEIANAAMRRRLSTIKVGDLHSPHPVPVPDITTVGQLAVWAGADGQATAYPVVRWDHRPIGYVVPGWSAAMSNADQSWTQVNQIMLPADQVYTADTSEAVSSLLHRLAVDSTTVIVTGSHHGAIGTLTNRQIQPVLAPPTLWGNDRKLKAAPPQPDRNLNATPPQPDPTPLKPPIG